jgi:ubiquinone/menaquinone biosynthesis C-methylase UbiE
MTLSATFDEWAADDRDREMEDHHWHTAKHALARMPVESGDTVLDLGTGSGYALRALSDVHRLDGAFGIDASPAMVRSARENTEADGVEFAAADFHDLPVATDAVDHVWSMEAFFFSQEPTALCSEVRRVLRPGGTFFCAVNFYEESEQSHRWRERIDVPMRLWSRREYRELFREAGLAVASQDTIPDEEVEIPPAEAFPTEEFDSREAMVDRYRTWGTLLTVGVAP